tara:strand:- start:1264 stop:2967 length:1704 start_codon:yes stop_codon:yes gene_type:complete
MINVTILIILCFGLNAANWTVNSGNFYYQPSTLVINVGDNVEWVNDGGFHDVNGATNTITGNPFNNPESFYVGPPTSDSVIGNYTFTIPGQYEYDCSVGAHAQNGMVGTIIVNPLVVEGCTDSNAITCDDDIDTVYFPECETCSDTACDNYYNPEATIDNGLCMYNDIPSDEEFVITATNSGYNLDWSAFNPPVDVEQYVLQRCLDVDGDTDGDGYFEYEQCIMVIQPNSSYLDTSFSDEFDMPDNSYIKYTFYVHYPNNNYWGSANGAYYDGCTNGYSLLDSIPNSTVVLDGGECFSNVDLSALEDIISANSLTLDSPLHLGTQNWTQGRITRLEAGDYFQGGSVSLTTIPESVKNMSSLSVLYFDNNELTQLPNSITELSNLFYLVLSFNQLVSLPDDIGNLTNLYWLDVGYNELESLPDSISNLQSLSYLWIFNNNLIELPSTFCDLNINWDSDDFQFLPYFGAGGNQLCTDVPSCIESSSNLNSSVDPLYYAFEITVEQECSCSAGDLNEDGILNVIDIVALVSIVLNPSEPTSEELCIGDLNSDGIINVIDIVSLVNNILSL